MKSGKPLQSYRAKHSLFLPVLALCAVTATASFAESEKIHGYLALDTMPYTRCLERACIKRNGAGTYGIRAGVTLAHDRVLLEGTERDYTFDHHATRPETPAHREFRAAPSSVEIRIIAKAHVPAAATPVALPLSVIPPMRTVRPQAAWSISRHRPKPITMTNFTLR